MKLRDVVIIALCVVFLHSATVHAIPAWTVSFDGKLIGGYALSLELLVADFSIGGVGPFEVWSASGGFYSSGNLISVLSLDPAHASIWSAPFGSSGLYLLSSDVLNPTAPLAPAFVTFSGELPLVTATLGNLSSPMLVSNFTQVPFTSPVPEPAINMMLVLGLMTMMAVRAHRRKTE